MHIKTIRGTPYVYDRGRCWGPIGSKYAVLAMAVAEAQEDEREAERIAAVLQADDDARRLKPLVDAGRDLRAYGREVDAVVDEALGMVGYHRRRRGPWRKRRAPRVGNVPAVEIANVPPSSIARMLQLEKFGDEKAARDLPAALHKAAHRTGGDVERNTINAIVRTIPGGDDPKIGEAIQARAELMRRELAPPGSPPVERLLATRVVCDWLHCQAWEQLAAAILAGNSYMPKTMESVQKHFDAAARRYTRSLVALAKVQRLDIPVAIGQVNVAQPGSQQVNQAAITDR